MKIINRIILICLLVIVVFVSAILINRYQALSPAGINTKSTVTSSVKFVSSTITADGTVTAQNIANLHFQTAGKLVYLPIKEGDKVSQGQTIASLDSYALQRQLTSALNIYRSTRDSFDQQVADSQNNYLQAQQYYPYNTYNAAGISGTAETNAINDVVKRIIDQNQANLDNSVINVELANYALQLSKLVSPINGIVTHEDVDVAGQNITSTTSFTVADPETMVFRANIPTEYIYYISEGSPVSLAIDGLDKKISGTVVKIYPAKVTLSTGQAVYQIDIQSDDLKKLAKFDLGGTAIIDTNAKHVALVPAWTVLSGKYIWIDNDGKPTLKKVTVGKVHGNEIEVIDGLSSGDKIITDPMVISAKKYQML
ncbi:efflux RND transporter periplasmic adaptor subunit [Patescibacteria group bacterium]|nr:efflux RND transporter periplasmic adaptor subunit [Patescibacteria group bacterium]